MLHVLDSKLLSYSTFNSLLYKILKIIKIYKVYVKYLSI
jgi:hypothetical protein